MKRKSSKGRPDLLLLDVNVLLALAWPNHQFHLVATERLEQPRDCWATCALTQLGFIRLSSNPAIVGVAKSPSETAALLDLLVQDSRHRFLASLPAPSGESILRYFDRTLSGKQVTDAYLLALAEKNNARLVTFDTRLPGLALSPKHLEVLPSL